MAPRGPRGGLLLIASGAMLGASYYVPWLVFNLVALVPLLFWLDGQRERSSWARLRGAWLAGIVAHLIGTYFILALARFSMLAALLYPALAVLLGLKVALIVTVAEAVRRRLQLSWAVVLPVCWVTADWALAFGDLRLTADHLYHGMSSYPFLVQFADVTGPYGVTWIVVAVNAMLYELGGIGPDRIVRRSAVGLVALVAVVLAYDGWAWTRDRPPVETLSVGVVQPNVEMTMKWDDQTARSQWEKLDRLTREAVARGAEVVVWPETAYPWSVFHRLDRPETYNLALVERLAAELDVTILAGVEYVRARSDDDYDLYNAAMVVTPRGLSETWSAKSYLVPFTEKLPFRGLIGPLVEGRGGAWRWVTGGFAESGKGATLPVAGSEVGGLVCYEQLFPDLFRAQGRAGASWFAVITNDAWFARTPFQGFQANAVRLRAIETRRDVVRAANTGISAFADARGNLFDATPLYEEAVLVRDVALYDGVTIYTTIGDVAAWLALAVLVSLVLLCVRAPRR